MLQTIEAVYDPKQGLSFAEAVEIDEPVRVLVTIIEPCRPFNKQGKGSAQALLAAMDAFPIPESEQLADADIEAQVAEARDSWE